MSEVEQAGAGDSDAKATKVIKRYANRKLYDTVESRYVTLDEIAEMIKQGVEVKIVDNRSKDDLTSVTLAQIIFEEEKKKSRMPLTVLREIIRSPGESISGFFQKELGARMASLREEAESRFELLKGSQRAFEEWQRRMDERLRAVFDNVVGGLPALGRDLQLLMQRIEQLEQRIQELEKQDPPSDG